MSSSGCGSFLGLGSNSVTAALVVLELEMCGVEQSDASGGNGELVAREGRSPQKCERERLILVQHRSGYGILLHLQGAEVSRMGGEELAPGDPARLPHPALTGDELG